MIDEPTAARLAAERTRLNTALERIRANGDLSDAGKAKLLAQQYATTRDNVASLKAAFEAQVAGSRTALERRLFTAPASHATSIISQRDAADRVDAIAPGDSRALGQLISRALAGDHTVLARAALRRAVDDGHADVVQQYTSAAPSSTGDLTTLVQLRAAEANTATATGGLQHYAQYAIDKPTELARYSDDQINALAAPGAPQVTA